MLRCATFNCNSVRNNAEIVKNILGNVDILCLQEIMLNKGDLDILNSFDNKFDYTAYVKDRETLGINEGRPTAGVAIFWRRNLSSHIIPVTIDDSLIGIKLDNGEEVILLLNAYLPCDLQNMNALDRYRNSLAILKTVVIEQNISKCIILGDFNADPFKGRFWKDLMEFCLSLSLTVVDRQLPNNTFTYLCPSKSTTSWLDHILCTKSVLSNVSDVYVDYESVIFDHFPLYLSLNFSIEPRENKRDNEFIRKLVNWQKISNNDKEEIRSFIEEIIDVNGILSSDLLRCSKINCRNEKHLECLDELFDVMINILLTATDKYSCEKSSSVRIIPGWNDFVKQYYAEARKHFLLWVKYGKPQSGIYIENMKSSRARFKTALDECRGNEDTIRRQKLLDNLHQKNYSGFWREVALIRNNVSKEVVSIDGRSDSNEICEIFSKKYQKIFSDNSNNIRNDNSAASLNKTRSRCITFTVHDINDGISQLKDSVGMDGIHSNHLKFCPNSYRYLISELFSSFSRHNYIPKNVLNGTITPTVKDRFGDLLSSDNYRPVMSSSVFFKLFEYCLQKKISPFIKFNDRQHGFRSKYSTNTACFVLKETVLNYFGSNTDVHACFIDIKKAFDSVNHNILMKKLLSCGIPVEYVDIIKYSYANQFVNVRFKSCYSEEWKIGRGVRQGGVLSGMLFNIYIDSLIDNVSSMKQGCKLGIHSANVIAYADDIVLLAPSLRGLQSLLDKAVEEASLLRLEFNSSKSKYMVFRYKKVKFSLNHAVKIKESILEQVTTFKYLGFVLSERLGNSDDINRVRSKFYGDFNSLLRKFSFASVDVKLYLFKQFCIQFYGADLWFYDKKCKQALHQLTVGYHKAIKKLLGVSTHESNHFVCQESSLFTFEHLLNKLKLFLILRVFNDPCAFIEKTLNFLVLSSVLLNEIRDIFIHNYEIELLFEQDREALISRIVYVQSHETPMREGWSP